MQLSLFKKLFLSILLVCGGMVVIMSFLINSSFREGLQSYINGKEIARVEILAEKVSAYYSEKNGWKRMESNPAIWASLLVQAGEMPPPRGVEGGGPGMPGRPGEAGRPEERGHPPAPVIDGENFTTALVPISMRLNLVDLEGRSILGLRENIQLNKPAFNLTKVEIIKNDEVVGWLTVVQSKQLSGQLAESFYSQQMSHFYVIVSLVVIFTFLFASFLVRHFLRPLDALQQGAKAMEEGELGYQIEVRGSDELAELTHNFNRLSESLRQQQETRNQWLSDISHELRTPLAVLRSEIEAIQDGIRKPDPERIASLHKQVLNLGKLVEDLYQLSVSDSEVRLITDPRVDITGLIDGVINQNRVRFETKNLQLVKNYDDVQVSYIEADSKSLTQLFTNLLENSYRYTDEDGKVVVSVTEEPSDILVEFEDSSPGVPDESLPRLYDRLYRVDKSRSRANGGSGLGLSICENIVKAHQGSIHSEHSSLGGLKTVIRFKKVVGRNNDE